MQLIALIAALGAAAWLGAHAAATRPAAACPATTVRYQSAKHPTLGELPWVLARPETAGVLGFLVSYPRTPRDRRVNRSDGLVLWQSGARIVWSVPGTAPAAASLVARRLDGGGSARVPLTAGADGLVSTPSFPSSGCWRLTVHAGASEASVVARVVTRPRTLGCEPVRSSSTRSAKP